MGPLPKRRNSTGRGGRRQKQIKQAISNIITCANCGEPKLSHRICPACKTYAVTAESSKTSAQAK